MWRRKKTATDRFNILHISIYVQYLRQWRWGTDWSKGTFVWVASAPMEMTELQMHKSINVTLNSHCGNYLSVEVLLTWSSLERVHFVVDNLKHSFISIFKGFCLQISCKQMVTFVLIRWPNNWALVLHGEGNLTPGKHGITRNRSTLLLQQAAVRPNN